MSAQRIEPLNAEWLDMVVREFENVGPLRMSRAERMQIARALRNLAAGIRGIEQRKIVDVRDALEVLRGNCDADGYPIEPHDASPSTGDSR